MTWHCYEDGRIPRLWAIELMLCDQGHHDESGWEKQSWAGTGQGSWPALRDKYKAEERVFICKSLVVSGGIVREISVVR